MRVPKPLEFTFVLKKNEEVEKVVRGVIVPSAYENEKVYTVLDYDKSYVSVPPDSPLKIGAQVVLGGWPQSLLLDGVTYYICELKDIRAVVMEVEVVPV